MKFPLFFPKFSLCYIRSALQLHHLLHIEAHKQCFSSWNNLVRKYSEYFQKFAKKYVKDIRSGVPTSGTYKNIMNLICSHLEPNTLTVISFINNILCYPGVLASTSELNSQRVIVLWAGGLRPLKPTLLTL